MHASQPAPAILLRIPVFRRLAEDAGLATDTAIADRLGMNQASIWRLMAGETTPSSTFIARVLVYFPGVDFKDVFEVFVPDACRCAA